MTDADQGRAPAVDGLRPVDPSHVDDPATTGVFPGDPASELETVCGGAVDRAGSGSTAIIYGVLPVHH